MSSTSKGRKKPKGSISDKFIGIKLDFMLLALYIKILIHIKNNFGDQTVQIFFLNNKVKQHNKQPNTTILTKPFQNSKEDNILCQKLELISKTKGVQTLNLSLISWKTFDDIRIT